MPAAKKDKFGVYSSSRRRITIKITTNTAANRPAIPITQ
ncbi:hypothetical protein EVA_16314 [gut metagenome]|uniref:Uncharacterized protein n=1 Tax=gut metagenome TaxID=749906 RepID=J9G7Z7_9ZZZZ